MRAVTRVRSLGAAALAALVMVIAAPADADLRIRDLDVFLTALNDETSLVTRLAGPAEPAIRQSGRRMLSRVP